MKLDTGYRERRLAKRKQEAEFNDAYIASLTEIAKVQWEKAYALGWGDAIAEMILQLHNESETAPDGGYMGPLPIELEQWLTAVEKRMKGIS